MLSALEPGSAWVSLIIGAMETVSDERNTGVTEDPRSLLPT